MKKKATISIFATVFLALTLTLFSYAATKTQDGLQVELTTDKSSYTSSDTISVTVKVTNTGTTAVSDLTLENTIPTGYTKTTNTSSTKNVPILSAGDEAMLTTSFVKDDSGTSSAGNTSGDSGGTSSGSSNASSGSSGTGGSSNSSSSGSNSSSSGSSNSSSGERSTTNTTDTVTATNASNSSQSGDAYGAEDLTRGAGTTSATSGDDTTGGEISGINGDSTTSDVGDDSTDGALSNEGESVEEESGVISQNENAYDDGTVAGAEGSDIDGDTSDGGVSTMAIAVGVIAVVAIAVAIVKIKSGKKLLSILICVSMVSVFDGEMVLVVEAAEYKTIEVSESITVDGKSVQIVVGVKYSNSSIGVEGLSLPENANEYEQEMWGNFKVHKIIDVKTSKNIQSESEAISSFEERGFANVSVMYNRSIDGQYLGDMEAKSNSNDTHPKYWITYTSPNNNVWVVYSVNSDIYAYLLTHETKISDNYIDVFVAERNSITDYISKSSSYYEIEPYITKGIIKIIDHIDAGALDKYTTEEFVQQ